MDLPKAWIEAGAVAICERAHQHGSWDRVSDEIRASCMAESHACLAAVFGRAEVVFTSKYDGHDVECDCGVSAPGFTLNAGDTLVIVRGW